MRNHGVTHTEMLLQNSSDVATANFDTVLLSDGFDNLRCSPDAGLLLLGNNADCELQLALHMAFLPSELVDVVRFFFDPADQLTDKSSSDSELNCCLLVA